MSANTKDEIKNQDQSAKSLSGKENNEENTRFFQDEWANGIDKLFLNQEVTSIYAPTILDGMVARVYHIQMDQIIIAVCKKARTAIVVNIDGTTTFRGERVSTKANEGALIHYTKNQIEAMIVKQFEHLHGYRFIHVCGVLLPDKLSQDLKNLEKEESDVTKFSVGVNYKTIGKYITEKYKNGMDYAMRKSELADALDDIVDNENDYMLDENVVAYAWIKQKGNDFCFMPNLLLNDKSATERREHLLYCLQNDTSHYTTKPTKGEKGSDQVTLFLNAHNVPFDPKATGETKLQLVIDYIKNNYPPQKEISMLRLIDEQNADLRANKNNKLS